ncbi:hypothetical protein MsAg5_00600 [Methanosarcinaceae archaeon Ag5]|uniref:DUF63 family protein n=1 Tax=Methanolapillus africanus TaxID=3028297 RepID=A0AAE4MGL5_9EURY|nr:hypothetical protein [Methanosarcinaceae archaeon Ag5]
MSFTETLTEFIYTNYINPVIYDSGYNVFNTLTWAVILGIAVYFIIYSLRKMNIAVDKYSLGATLPFVVAGASLRVVGDSGVIQPPFSYVLITPNIYFFAFLVTALCLFVSLLLQKFKIVKSFYFVYAGLGCLFVAAVFIVLFAVNDVVHWWVPFAVVGVGLAITTVFGLVAKKLGSKIYSDKFNLTILLAHLMDATSTVIGIEVFGYYEKHVLPSFLIDLTGSALVMYPLKIAIFMIVVWILDKGLETESQGEDKDQIETIKNAIKFVIIILGLGPAIRNSLRVFFGI